MSLLAQPAYAVAVPRSEEHTSELQSQSNLVCRLLLEKKKNIDRSSRPMRKHLPSLELFEVSAIAHQWSRYFFRRFLTMIRRCNSFVPPSITTRARSR